MTRRMIVIVSIVSGLCLVVTLIAIAHWLAEAGTIGEVAMNARKRKTYYDLLGVYLKRVEKHRDKVDRAGAKCIRAANYLYRVRVEQQRLKRAIDTTHEAIKAYEKAPTQEGLYPPVRTKKAKKGRKIEL